MSEEVNESNNKQEPTAKNSEEFWENSKEDNKDVNMQTEPQQNEDKIVENEAPAENVTKEEENTEKNENVLETLPPVHEVPIQEAPETETKTVEVPSNENEKAGVPAPVETKVEEKKPEKVVKAEQPKKVEKPKKKTEDKKAPANKATPVKSSKPKKQPVKKVSEERRPTRRQQTKEIAPKKEKMPILRSKSLPELPAGPFLRKNRKTNDDEFKKYENLLNQKTKRKKF